MPVRLVRGDASPEELAALVTILATARGDGAPDPTDRHSPASGRSPHSPWSSPRRMVRMTHPHGPGGWRASALPRGHFDLPSGDWGTFDR
jgi:hypothetical protein